MTPFVPKSVPGTNLLHQLGHQLRHSSQPNLWFSQKRAVTETTARNKGWCITWFGTQINGSVGRIGWMGWHGDGIVGMRKVDKSIEWVGCFGLGESSLKEVPWNIERFIRQRFQFASKAHSDSASCKKSHGILVGVKMATSAGLFTALAKNDLFCWFGMT